MTEVRTSEGYEEIAMVLLENRSGELLLLRRIVDAEHSRASAGKWVPPGGHVEREGRDRGSNPNEDPKEAVRRAGIRETMEEAGLDISACTVEHISTFITTNGERKFLTHVLHVVLPQAMPIEIKLSQDSPHKEHDKYAWVLKDLMVRHILDPLQALRGDTTRPTGRSDYTSVSWEIVERRLVPGAAQVGQEHKAHGRPLRAV